MHLPEEDMSSFESLAESICRSDAKPIPYAEHPSPEIILGLLDGRIDSSVRNRVQAHLALCSRCAEQFSKLSASLKSETIAIEGMGQVSSLPAFLEARTGKSPGSWKRLAGVVRQVLAPRWERPVALSTAMALVICLVVLLPPALLQWRERATESIADFFFLEPIPQAGEIELTPRQLSQVVAGAAEVPGGEFAALVLGFLRAEGVPLWEKGLAFTRVGDYRVRAGDTWESIAEVTLQSRRLWPVIVLLNAENSPDGDLPPKDSTIKVPISDP